jgi:hypothetical protein
MRVGVWERAETVVIFLASRIPEGELDVLAIDLDVGDVVLENGGDIDLMRDTCQYVKICVRVGGGGSGCVATVAVEARPD